MSVITLNFEGYIQCRLATDPDPTDERRGVSGYTFALPGEPDLDWTIYTQPGPGVVQRAGVDREIGVKVASGFCGTDPVVAGHPLFGAPVELLDNPRFEERNYTIHTTSFGVISPFKMRIRGSGVELYRQVDFYPGKPLSTPVYEVPQQLLTPYTMSGMQINAAACTNLLLPSKDPSVYRKERLDKLLHIQKTARLDQVALAALEKRIEELRIDTPLDRRTRQLANLANFSYALNGPARVRFGAAGKGTWLNGKVDKDGEWQYNEPDRPLAPWPCAFWIGSWDADSLTCYMGGTVKFYDLGAAFDAWQAKE